jgi:hypothetical protein
MSYDELIPVLRGLAGRRVEATIRTPYEDVESGSGGIWFGHFTGTVDRLAEDAGPRNDHWTLYWHPNLEHSVTVWRDAFEGAEVRGSGLSLEEVVAEGSDSATWTVDIFQQGLLVELTAYVHGDRHDA